MITDRTRTILVIEDNEINRELLVEILSPKYKVIQAENGKTGLDILTQKYSEISLILLDIQMPVMNGYEFLDRINDMKVFANIPIIVTTSSATATDEIKCLENGASDFVAKPYNTGIVLKRVESMIRLSEASAVINKVERDSLTGMYSKEFFYINAARMTDSGKNLEYDVVCSDIQSFRVINERYGAKRSDSLLTYVADVLRKIFPDEAVFGRLGNDNFAMIFPHREDLDSLLENAAANATKGSTIPNAVVQFGFCRNIDVNLPVSSICDNAMLAIDGIKQQYGKQIVEYDENVKKRLIREQMILDNVEEALSENQFQVYYQAKHNLTQEKTGGAEALVRWINPEMGFMNPGEFIPLFEKTGFITRLDYYVLDRVCYDIHNWIKENKKVIPISMNISRADFDDDALVLNIKKLVDKYQIPVDLIHLEMTETAYNDDPAKIFKAITDLRSMGFHIELDDFGAGYSSLNILTDLELDVLKLDKSLVKDVTSEKQRFILKHIFSIAHGLGMEIVAEGVETEEQANELRKMGCTYAQGFLYSRPISKDEFTIYLNK